MMADLLKYLCNYEKIIDNNKLYICLKNKRR
jgi:hypothetical protein